MVKRLIAIPLVIIFTIAAFTSVYAVDSISDLPSPRLSFVATQYFPSGQRFYLPVTNFSSPQFIHLFYGDIGTSLDDSSAHFFFELLFNIDNLVSFDCTFIFRSRHYQEFIDFSDFSPYIVSSVVSTLDVPNSYYVYNPNSNSFSVSQGVSTSLEVITLTLRDLPSGYYSFTEDLGRLLIGFNIDSVTFSEPEPEPIPPSVFLSDLGMVVNSSLSWVTSSVDTITSYPFLLLTVGFFALCAAVSFIGRLLSRD